MKTFTIQHTPQLLLTIENKSPPQVRQVCMKTIEFDHLYHSSLRISQKSAKSNLKVMLDRLKHTWP